MTTDNISIIGGGIGGIVTALCFEKLNISYTLYERTEEIKAVGAGIWLSPNALQVFEWIDPALLAEIQQSGNPLTRILVADHQLKPISDSDQAFAKQQFGYTTLAIHRGRLQQILYNYAQRKNIELGRAFRKFTDNGEQLTLHFESGRTVNTNSIIGADGIHSNVRKQLFPESKLRYSGQTCWRGVSNFSMDREFESVGFTLWGEKLQFGVSKIAEGKVYWFAVKRSAPNLQDNREQLKNELTALLSPFHHIVNDLIENTPLDSIIRGDLRDLELLDSWSKQRVCLIGDAAHSMTPDLGQGGAQAIEDGFYLAHFIQESTNLQKAYADFYQFRKSKVEKLVKQSRLTSKIAITNRFMEIVRNTLLKITPQSYVQKQMIELYTIDKNNVGSSS